MRTILKDWLSRGLSEGHTAKNAIALDALPLTARAEVPTSSSYGREEISWSAGDTSWTTPAYSKPTRKSLDLTPKSEPASPPLKLAG